MAPTLTFTQALAQAETQARTKLPDELHERLTLSRIRKVRGGTADQVNRFSSHYLSRGSKSFHIPTDLVVAQEASPVESSSRLDFLLLHNLGMSFVAP